MKETPEMIRLGALVVSLRETQHLLNDIDSQTEIVISQLVKAGANEHDFSISRSKIDDAKSALRVLDGQHPKLTKKLEKMGVVMCGDAEFQSELNAVGTLSRPR